jgi:hypothetical protein
MRTTACYTPGLGPPGSQFFLESRSGRAAYQRELTVERSTNDDSLL